MSRPDFAKRLVAMTVMKIINDALPNVMPHVMDKDDDDLWTAYSKARQSNLALWHMVGRE